MTETNRDIEEWLKTEASKAADQLNQHPETGLTVEQIRNHFQSKYIKSAID